MFIETLKKKYPIEIPIFISEIFKLFPDLSRQRIYQIIEEEIKKDNLRRYEEGIYYVPDSNYIDFSTLSVNQVVEKKYIRKDDEVFGIYGNSITKVNFFITKQIPNTIEVITNNESRKNREILINGRNVLLRKSRVKITNDNYQTYRLLELFNDINIDEYKSNDLAQNEVRKYIKDNNITKNMIMNLICYFPNKTSKNIILGDVLDEAL